MQLTKIICDHYISEGWYKVLHEDDPNPRTMLEGRVSSEYCGTISPIWLNGKFEMNCKYILLSIIFSFLVNYGSELGCDH